MNILKSRREKRANGYVKKGYAQKAAIYLLIVAILAPCFHIWDARADVAGLTVVKTVTRDAFIAGGGAASYQPIADGDTTNMAHTNVLRYSNAITNDDVTPVTIDLRAEMPTNCILFLSGEWYGSGDGRKITGTSPVGGGVVTDLYDNVYYSWLLNAAKPDYAMSIDASVVKDGTAALQLHGPHTLTNTVTIAPGSTYTFDYAVIVYTDDEPGHAVTDEFYINNILTTPVNFFIPQQSLTTDAEGSVTLGAEVTYTLHMKSVGTTAAIELEIPAGTTYQASSLSMGGQTPAAPPVIGSDKISFTLTNVPLDTEFTVSYTVEVGAGAISVNNTQTKLNGTFLNPINLNVSAGNIIATAYAVSPFPSQGIVAGQEITYTATIQSKDGTALSNNATLSIPLPADTSFVSTAGGDFVGVENNGFIDFDITGLDSTPQDVVFTLRLTDGASGNLSVGLPGLGIPSAWVHPILVVTKSLEKDSTIAGDTLNTSLPNYSPLADGDSVEYQDLVKFVYSVKNTGTIAVDGVHLEAPTPDDTVLYITFKSPLYTFGVIDYDTTTGVASIPSNPLLFTYANLAHNWEVNAGSLTDYERSIEANEASGTPIMGAFYGPFVVYKDNVSLAPNEEIDFRYASFVNTEEVGAQICDAFTVNGVMTTPVSVAIPGYSISSDPVPYTSVRVGDEITYTFTMPTQTATTFEADIPLGTSLKPGSATTVTDSGQTVTVSHTTSQIKLAVEAGTSFGQTSVSYTVVITDPTKVFVNNVNVDKDGGIDGDGSAPIGYLGSISHNLDTGVALTGVVLDYIYASHINNNFVGYNAIMSFKFYVQNNTENTLENVVVTVPIDENLRLDPATIAYWLGSDSVILDKDGIAHSSYNLAFNEYLSPDFAAYDALAPFSIQWTIPSIEPGQAITALGNSTGKAAELGFSGKVKSLSEIPNNVRTMYFSAFLTASGLGTTVLAPTLMYFFEPRPFIGISSDKPETVRTIPSGTISAQNPTQYAHGEIISYTVFVDPAEVNFPPGGELFIASTIPADAKLIGSVEVFKRDVNDPLDVEELDSPDVVIDLVNPGKVRIKIPNPDPGYYYLVNYSVQITAYTGMLRTYAIGQVFDIPGADNAVDAAETDVLQHNISTPRSTVTIESQLLTDMFGEELATIPQSVGGGLPSLPVEFVITFTDESGNEYNALMKNGDSPVVFYGLPYNERITITEIGTSNTFFKEVIDLEGNVTLSDDEYSFTLSDTNGGRHISFTIVSEYRPSGGFSSAASRNNPFKIPNYDFTALLKYQLQDLASTQIDNGVGDGAIPISDDALAYDFATQRFSVRPYFSLTVANAFLLDPDYYDNAKRYIEWHIRHLNEDPDIYLVTGSIYDYYYSLLGSEQRALSLAESNDTVDVYDSTDSYAALFFELLLNYTTTTGDYSFITKPTLDLVLQCLEESFSGATFDGDALLTVAKPNYLIEFLMDNCEVYRGFVSLEELYDMIGCGAEAAQAADYARRIKEGIETHLYNSGNGNYDYAYLNLSYIEDYFYPDAIAQMFPIIFDIVDPDDIVAIKLYDDFCANFPYWTDMANVPRPDAPYSKVDRSTAPSEFPNALILKAAVKMGDLDGAIRGFMSMDTRYRQEGNPFPVLCFESGETARCIPAFMNAYYAMCSEVFTAVPKFAGGY